MNKYIANFAYDLNIHALIYLTIHAKYRVAGQVTRRKRKRIRTVSGVCCTTSCLYMLFASILFKPLYMKLFLTKVIYHCGWKISHLLKKLCIKSFLRLSKDQNTVMLKMLFCLAFFLNNYDLLV